MRWLWCLFLFLVCCEAPEPGPREIKVVPNETPPQRLVPVPLREQASTAEILALEARRQAEEKEAETQAEEKEKQARMDLRTMDPATLEATVDRYGDTVFPKTKPLPALPPPDGFQRTPVPPDPLDYNRPKPRVKAPEQPKQRPGGRRLFLPRPSATPSTDVTELVPPGRFFSASLIGNVTVSVFAPIVMAKIHGADGRVIGTAFGKAGLHRVLKDRALVTFSQVHLDDGRVFSGSLTAFDLDLSQGLVGRVENPTFKQFALATAEAILAALSLEVDVAGDGFGQVFKFNLAKGLLDQSRGHLNQLDLTRRIYLERDRFFWVTGTRGLSVRENGIAPGLDAVTTQARDAFKQSLQSRAYSAERRQQLETAYQTLQEKLRSLPGSTQ